MHLLRRLASSAIAVRPVTTCSTPAFPFMIASLPNSLPHHPSFIQRHSNSTTTMASTDTTLRAFFQFPKFAVVGASNNTEKYGYKVFKWYTTRNLAVTPINPGSPSISVDGVEHPTVVSLADLPAPLEDTAVSLITPPLVTFKTLQLAKELGIQAVFLQPGTFDDVVLEFARENFKTVLAGEGGHGREGWCVLVDGDRGLTAAGKL